MQFHLALETELIMSNNCLKSIRNPLLETNVDQYPVRFSMSAGIKFTTSRTNALTVRYD